MKKTWVVHVGPGIGHELHGAIADNEWYGPYTKETAEKLEADLNAVYAADLSEERTVACAMPLDPDSPRRVVAAAKREIADLGD